MNIAKILLGLSLLASFSVAKAEYVELFDFADAPLTEVQKDALMAAIETRCKAGSHDDDHVILTHYKILNANPDANLSEYSLKFLRSGGGLAYMIFAQLVLKNAQSKSLAVKFNSPECN